VSSQRALSDIRSVDQKPLRSEIHPRMILYSTDATISPPATYLRLYLLHNKKKKRRKRQKLLSFGKARINLLLNVWQTDNATSLRVWNVNKKCFGMHRNENSWAKPIIIKHLDLAKVRIEITRKRFLFFAFILSVFHHCINVIVRMCFLVFYMAF